MGVITFSSTSSSYSSASSSASSAFISSVFISSLGASFVSSTGPSSSLNFKCFNEFSSVLISVSPRSTPYSSAIFFSCTSTSLSICNAISFF